MIFENWKSEMQLNPNLEIVPDVKITIYVEFDGVRRITYAVRVYKREDGRPRLLEVMYPHGVPVNRLPRGAKRELRRVFPLALMML